MPAASGAPLPIIDLPEGEARPRPLSGSGLNPGAGTERATLDSTDLAAIAHAEPTLGGVLTIAPTRSWFDSREFGFDAANDNFTALSELVGCVYPDSYLRSFGGGPDECGVLTPGGDKSAILTLPFLAVFGWVLTICGVAGLRRTYGSWRTRRWVRQLHARGLAPPMASSISAPRRSSSRGRTRRRRYG